MTAVIYIILAASIVTLALALARVAGQETPKPKHPAFPKDRYTYRKEVLFWLRHYWGYQHDRIPFDTNFIDAAYDRGDMPPFAARQMMRAVDPQESFHYNDRAN